MYCCLLARIVFSDWITFDEGTRVFHKCFFLNLPRKHQLRTMWSSVFAIIWIFHGLLEGGSLWAFWLFMQEFPSVGGPSLSTINEDLFKISLGEHVSDKELSIIFPRGKKKEKRKHTNYKGSLGRDWKFQTKKLSSPSEELYKIKIYQENIFVFV